MLGLNKFIDFNDYNNFAVIGENKYTSITSANKRESPFKKYLFKIFNFPCNSSKDQKIILETFCQIGTIKNQYLINYKKISFSYQSKYYASFLLKYVSSKTLEQVIVQKNPNDEILNETSIYHCLFAVAEAMYYLHGHIICHGNLCPSNIILDKLNQFYLCDFGLYPIKKLYFDKNDIFNKDYKDPLMQNAPSFKNDIYSYGILICHLFLVFNQAKSNEYDKKETLTEFIKNPNPDKYSQFPKFISELIQLCINSDLSKRPTFKKIIDIFKTVKNEAHELNVSELYSKFIKADYNRKLAKSNDPQALNHVGKMYSDKFKDDQKALKYF